MTTEKHRALWKQAFGDSDAFLDDFFTVGYAPDCCGSIYDGENLVAAAYWFEMAMQEKKLAYIYAVATDESYRRQGYCHRLLQSIHQTLQDNGCDGAVLVPADAGLAKFYGSMGYLPFGKICHKAVKAAGKTELQQLTAEEYCLRRRQYLPEGGIEPGRKMLEFLGTFADFYAGDGFVCCAVEDFLPEFLGQEENLPAIVAALGLESARVRLAGGNEDFAMYLPLSQKGKDVPAYFSLALD